MKTMNKKYNGYKQLFNRYQQQAEWLGYSIRALDRLSNEASLDDQEWITFAKSILLDKRSRVLKQIETYRKHAFD